MAVSSFPAHMQEAIAQALSSQERIGWYQASSKGFFSQQRSQLATQDLNHPTKLDENLSASRMRQIIHMRPIIIPLGSGKLGTQCYMLRTIQTWRTSDQLSLRKYGQFMGIQNVWVSRIVTCATTAFYRVFLEDQRPLDGADFVVLNVLWHGNNWNRKIRL